MYHLELTESPLHILAFAYVRLNKTIIEQFSDSLSNIPQACEWHNILRRIVSLE